MFSSTVYLQAIGLLFFISPLTAMESLNNSETCTVETCTVYINLYSPPFCGIFPSLFPFEERVKDNVKRNILLGKLLMKIEEEVNNENEKATIGQKINIDHYSWQLSWFFNSTLKNKGPLNYKMREPLSHWVEKGGEIYLSVVASRTIKKVK